MAEKFGWGPQASEEVSKLETKYGPDWTKNASIEERKALVDKAHAEWDRIHGEGYDPKIIDRSVLIDCVIASAGTCEMDSEWLAECGWPDRFRAP